MQNGNLFPETVSSQEIARQANQKHVDRIEARARPSDAVLAPVIRLYNSRITASDAPIDLLRNLTAPLLEAFDETRHGIEARMKEKWVNNPERVGSSVTNSLRRSAGTNFQGLVSYALAKYLLATSSTWYLQHPVPKDLSESLAIRFTAGLPLQANEEAENGRDSNGIEVDTEGQGEKSSFVVKPDVDIMLRDAAWQGDAGGLEPIILLSVKTSLADRAGSAARWKLYFDLVTNPCPFLSRPGCAYQSLGIEMDNPNGYRIQHAIVTANIYKFNFHDVRFRKGELASGQTRSNTYMFNHKYTTRDDEEAETPPDWKPFAEFAALLNKA